MFPNGFRIVTALLAICLLTACHHPNSHAYDAHGIIQHISDDRHLVTIQHDAIPGYMPAMTMDFSVRDPHVLEQLPCGMRGAGRLDAPQCHRKIRDHRFQIHMRALHAQQIRQVLTE